MTIKQLGGVFGRNPTFNTVTIDGGINFLGGAGASLDDYEEGTWTPAWTYETPGDFAATYSVQSGNYVKVGSLVHVRCRLSLTSFVKGTAAGELLMEGLPYAAASGDGHSHFSIIGFSLPLPAVLGNYPAVFVEAGLSAIEFRTQRSNNTFTVFPTPGSTSQVYLAGFYQAA